MRHPAIHGFKPLPPASFDLGADGSSRYAQHGCACHRRQRLRAIHGKVCLHLRSGTKLHTLLDFRSRRRPVVIATSRHNDLSASERRAFARARPRSNPTRTHPPRDEYEGLLKQPSLFSHERPEKTSPLFAMLRNPPLLPPFRDGVLRTIDSQLDTRNRLDLQQASDSDCQFFCNDIDLFSQPHAAVSTKS